MWLSKSRFGSYDFTIPPSQNDPDICDCSGSYDSNDPKRP